MADPVTASISLGLTAAGGLMSMFGANQSANAQTSMYNYKAAVAQANAAYAEKNAQYALQEGQFQESVAGAQGKQEVGRIRTAEAASGVDINRGTAKDIVTSQIKQIQTNEGVINYDAAKKAYGFSVQAANFQNEAQFDIMSGKNVQAAKYYTMGESLLGAASSVSSKWLSYSRAGIFA